MCCRKVQQDAAAAHAKEVQEAEEAMRVLEDCKSAVAAAKAAGDSAAVEKADAALHEAMADYNRELAEAEEAKEAAIHQLPSCVRICGLCLLWSAVVIVFSTVHVHQSGMGNRHKLTRV